ncbi:MAG TPA: hypothetical protein VJ579_05085 [Candidatus Paceibacterota bacterium]|nr:hypothetical protein [Candidatus Paceibacterota bacterium]
MAIPLYCPSCQTLIGIEAESTTLNRALCMIDSEFADMNLPHCPGKIHHKDPVVFISSAFFGWIKKKKTFYPETGTTTEAKIYKGPKSWFALWLIYAVHLEPNERLFFNFAVIYKGPDGKLEGKGLEELGLR